MTKFCYMSDTHLEFGGRDFDLPDADVLLLAGDICLAYDLLESNCGTLQGSNARKFFKDVSAKYKHVAWVPGNHEYYGSSIKETSDIVNQFIVSENLFNITFGQFGSITVKDVKIVFATLWTDIKNKDPLIMSQGKQSMSDYCQIMIEVDGRNLQLHPSDVYDLHVKHREHIKNEVVGHDKVIVMTHHAPNMLSSKSDNITSLDYMYCCTDMDDIILDNPQIKVWVHGHLHTEMKYTIGETEIMSNCRGYYGYEPTQHFKVNVFEL